jgi:hypothetical protein
VPEPTAPTPVVDDDCDLCRADKLTRWYHEDDLCWVAECNICATPMVVLRHHHRRPDEAVLAALHERLAQVVATYFTFEHWIDDEMRRIPDHYHAHARPVGGFFGHGLARAEP